MGRISRWAALLALAVGTAAGVSACAPLSPTPPFHFGETQDALARGRTAISPAAGAGSFKTIGGGVGAAFRVRHGLGGGNELRGELAAIGRINEDDPTPAQPWLGKSTAWLYKLGWKKALASWLAVDAGAGGSHSATGNALGGDVAMTAGTRNAYFGGRVRPYLGARGSLAIPVGRDRDEAGGITRGLVGALGTALDVSPVTQLFVELGAMEEWNRGYFSTDVNPDRTVESQHHPGGYLAFGATFFLGGRVRAPAPTVASP